MRYPLLLSTLFSTLLATTTGGAVAQDDKENLANPKPEELRLRRKKDNVAVISALFPDRKPGSQLDLIIDGKPFTLSDNGENGDSKEGDGWFSIETEMDFELLAKANEIFGKVNAERERSIFEPGGRRIIGNQVTFLEGEEVFVKETIGRETREFILPTDPGRFEFDVDFPIPVHGLPIGLPADSGSNSRANIDESLMIRKLSVVNDPSRTWSCQSTNQQPSGNPVGEWTFWKLMENISNGTMPTSDFIKALFDQWNTNLVINGQSVPARPNVYDEVIGDWEIRSGGPGAPLLPDQSPFKLLGVVLRLDLRGGQAIYGGGDAGEGRFVFSLHDGDCNSLGKTIILEYKVPISGCDNVRHWAQQWKDLESSANYNGDLAALTEIFSAAGAAPSRPNGSAISQVRTNELLPASPGWELREFVLNQSGGILEQTTVKQEPQQIHNNSALLADYINTHWPNLTVPEDFGGTDFLAGRAPAPILWNTPFPLTPPDPDEAMFQVAFDTCSGCHTLETGTNFAHLHYNTQPGQEAILSGFLTGISLPDPRQPSIMRTFNDLDRRADDLDLVANSACPTIERFPIGNALLQELTLPPMVLDVH